MSDTRIVIVFTEPPAMWRFTPSASGKSWHRTVKTLDEAQKLAAVMVELDIHGVIKRSEDRPRRQSGQNSYRFRRQRG